MKKLMTILIILSIGTFFVPHVLADNNQTTIHTDANSMFITGNGKGTSVEQAKIAAIKDILCQLSDEEIISSLPNSSTYTKFSDKDDVAVISEGLEKLLATLYTEGYWQFKDGTYHYSIKILIRREIPEMDTK